MGSCTFHGEGFRCERLDRVLYDVVSSWLGDGGLFHEVGMMMLVVVSR